MEFRIEAKIESNGTIVLHDLPFQEGDKVMVVITTQPAPKFRLFLARITRGIQRPV